MQVYTSASLAGLALIGLSACSEKTQDQSAQTGNAIAADDIEATTDRAADRTGDHLANAGDSIEATADRTGNAISNGADHAADATGTLLEKAGKKLKN